LKLKVIYIISNIDKALAFEWLVKYINYEKIDLSFIILNPAPSSFEYFLKGKKIPFYSVKYSSKKDLLPAFIKITRILFFERPAIVHTHLFEASLLGLMSAKLLFIKKRIYTRHHSTSNHLYYPHAVKYDKLINLLATHIISISKNVSTVLIEKENVAPAKITLIHHGLDMSEIENIEPKDTLSLKTKYNSSERSPVIGVISRYIHLKGIQFIIPAFKKLLKTHPDAYLILANAKGEYSFEIKKLLYELPKSSYIEIDFENKLFNLYKLFDVFIHVPIDKQCEAFGQIYIESLACEIPSIFTLSGIAGEFIIDRKNALVVPFQDSEGIYKAIIELISDKKLCNTLTKQGRIDIENSFNIKNVINSLETLYLS
jgi:glycosyltransferase involved in cell wall biosynthesis